MSMAPISCTAVMDVASTKESGEIQANSRDPYYRLEYVDLAHFQPDRALFHSIPVDLMLRYNFLPYRREDGHLVVAIADPTEAEVMDELSSLLDTPLKAVVSADTAIQEVIEDTTR